MNRATKIKALKALVNGDRTALIGLIPEQPLFVDYAVKNGIYYLENGISGPDVGVLEKRLMDGMQPQFLGNEINYSQLNSNR